MNERELDAVRQAARALWTARSVIDSLMGDSDLLVDDDSPEFEAMTAINGALAALEEAFEWP